MSTSNESSTSPTISPSPIHSILTPSLLDDHIPHKYLSIIISFFNDSSSLTVSYSPLIKISTNTKTQPDWLKYNVTYVFDPYSSPALHTLPINTSLCTLSSFCRAFQVQLSTIQESISYSQTCKHN